MIDQRIEQALRSTTPVVELRSLIVHLLGDGRPRETILQLFEAAREEMRQTGREVDEEVVMDVMDFLVGWCSPHMKLPPESMGCASRIAAELGTAESTTLP
jgi:hypothetical protein